MVFSRVAGWQSNAWRNAVLGIGAGLILCRHTSRRKSSLGETSVTRTRPSKWMWAVAVVAVFSLTGCGMYPSKPNDWPGGIWGQILKFVSSVIDYFAHHMGNNYGLALLVVTVLVRLLILPLMIKQIRNSKMMQQLQPQVAQIREKHKGDNRKIQEETMKLWQSHGFNPMAGCLPMVIQLPVLYALFGAIQGNYALHHSTFMWIWNLGQPDKYYILPILAAVTTFLSSKVMMTGNDQQTKMMLYIMPVTVLLIGSHFAAGLALYWIYSNLFTTVQTYFIRVRPAQAEAAGGGTTKPGVGKNNSSGKPTSGKPAMKSKPTPKLIDSADQQLDKSDENQEKPKRGSSK